ncbi:MAG: glycosyltransferase family 2 protein [Planctomycetaceae bacterium]|nr:glycosyltransferase family 2 protein [Planctomycetaceae bacterium]
MVRAETDTTLDPLPFISVIMPVRNEAARIERTLCGLIDQDYERGRWEILVVDGESSDGTAAIAERIAVQHPVIRVLANPRRLSSAARNIGVNNARGDVVVIVDGHCEIEDDQYLRKLAAAFARSGADCVGRPQPLDVTGATALQQAIGSARSCWLGHHPASHIYSSEAGFVPAGSVAVAYRRSVFDKVGGFDERFDACEDVELNHRIDQSGLRCYLAPEVAVRYMPRATLPGLFFQMTRYGRGRLRLLRKHPATLSLGSVTPLIFTVGLGVGLPLGMADRWLAAVYFGAIALYAAVVATTSVFLALRARNGWLLFWLPPVFATVHVGAGVGMLWELFHRGGQPHAGIDNS